MPRAKLTASTPARGAGRPRSAASERAIIDATLKLLADEGYAALTTDRVAAKARVSKSTIYRRWPTKEHLVLAVFEVLPLPVPPEGRGLEEELTALFSGYGRYMRTSPLRGVLPRLAAEAVANPALSGALIRVNEMRREPTRIVLQRAIARGEVPADIDVEVTVDVIQGAIAIRQLFLLDELKPAWVRKLVRLVVGGVAGTSDTERAPKVRSR